MNINVIPSSICWIQHPYNWGHTLCYIHIQCKLAKNILEKYLVKIEDEISEMCADENAKIIREQVENISNISGEFDSNKMWQVKKVINPKISDAAFIVGTDFFCQIFELTDLVSFVIKRI